MIRSRMTSVNACLRLLPLAVLVFGASVVAAQGTAGLRGFVRDSATSRPLIGVTVELSTQREMRSTRSDEAGSYRFTGLQAGEYVLSVRNVGYLPLRKTIQVAGNDTLAIEMRRIAQLDTVRVRATSQGIYGVVALAWNLQPIPGATVEVLGKSPGKTTTDSAGRFFLPVKSTGSYLVRGRAPNRGQQAVSLSVEENAVSEVSLLLDSIPEDNANALERAYSDFRERLLRVGQGGVAVSRRELLWHGDGELMSSLMLSIGKKGLRMSNRACLFVDGVPRPGQWLFDLDATDAEMLEVYTLNGDESKTLSEAWPRGAVCANTGMPRATTAMTSSARSTDVVFWVVVWLKH